jgi:hypothetical protein
MSEIFLPVKGSISVPTIPQTVSNMTIKVWTDKRNGMKFHLGKDFTPYAELLKRKGDKKIKV